MIEGDRDYHQEYVGSMSKADRKESFVARFAFVGVMGGALASAIFWMGKGLDPPVALILSQFPAFLIVIFLERRIPFHAVWNQSQGDLSVDIRHGLTISIMAAIADPLLTALGVVVAVTLLGGHTLGLWPTGWPLLLQLPLALLIGEFGQYWVHRLQHEVDFMWRFHALHHSAPRLYWLNAARFHPLDILLNNFVALVPLAFLGAGEGVLALWALFAAVHGIFQHSNLPTRIGPLNWIFSMAELHRWHHSRLVEESNRNYGQNLIIWDVVFGTRFLPEDREPPLDIGLHGLSAYPMTYWAQQSAPFHWRQIREDSAKMLPPRKD